jgi:tyrosine-protein kinase Etk/Wzc
MRDGSSRVASLPHGNEGGRPSTSGAFPGPARDDKEPPTLADVVELLRRSRWLIAGSVLAGLLLGCLYLVGATPIYRADVLVQVEEKQRGSGEIDELSNMLSERTPSETEMEILRSRSLVGSVVDQLRLDVEVKPVRFPLFGNFLARRWSQEAPAPSRLGLSSFAWGGERIQLDRLTVGRRWIDRPLTLVSRSANEFALLDEDGRQLLVGQVGRAAEAGDGPARIDLFVSELVARPGTRFAVRKARREDAVARLQDQIQIGERGRKTGVIELAMEGADPQEIASILDAVAQVYLRQNVERKSAEAEKTLQFIETQLPVLKANLDRAEAQLNGYRLSTNSVDLSLETKGILDRTVDIEKALTELSMQQSELRQRFTNDHPVMTALRQKQEKLQGSKAALEQKMKALPEAELDSARLARDVKVATELYFLFINKAQGLRVVKSGTLGNVRVLDTAVVPHQAVRPRVVQTLVLWMLLGLGVGVGAAFAWKALDRGVDDPDVIERASGVAVYASIPHSRKQDDLIRQYRREHRKARPVLAQQDSTDLAVEALRSLRTSLQFSLLEAHSNAVAVVGAAPGAGKSFVAVNLATVLADAGKQVILVDADLRKGRIHNYFGGERRGGLAELVAGELTLERAIRTSSIAGLHYLTTGALPANPSELLASDRLKAVVDLLSERYDIVLLDTAPILAVTDGAIVGRLAGVNLMVLRAGVHPVREVIQAAKRFRQNGVQLHGVILNDVELEGRAGKYSTGYHYHYEYKADD